MVAQAPPATPTSAAKPPAAGSAQAGRTVGTARHMVDHLGTAAKLQWQILVLKCKLKLQRAITLGVLGAVAAAVGILGVIFTYIFVFHALRLVLAAFWVWLIFAGAHLLAAIVLVAVAKGVMEKMKKNQV